LQAARSPSRTTEVQARAKQSEAKSNLKAIFTAEVYFPEHDTYSSCHKKIGLTRARNRYQYALNTTRLSRKNTDCRELNCAIPARGFMARATARFPTFKHGANVTAEPGVAAYTPGYP
jgi:hypothetical protein